MARRTATKTSVVIPIPVSGIAPYCDHERRTCIQVERAHGHVKYIPLDVGTGLEVRTLRVDAFDQRFIPMVNYPVEKACQLYLGYSQNIGATKEALDYLGQIIDISNQESEMATRKKAAAPAEKKLTASRAASEAKASAKSSTKAPAAKAAGETKASTKAPAAKAAPRRLSAAQMFQDLIMEGKLTDDKIFEQVQEVYNLDEKKRGYVKWYRNHLKKQGMNPPEAKVK